MQIDTNVFKRITKENRKAAIKGIAAIMCQTARFGTFDEKYVLQCAEDFFDNTLTEVRATHER